MAWNSSTKILTKPFTKIGVSQGDLEKALGVSTKKTQIQLFTETDIKIAAKYKPFQNTTALFSTSGTTSGDRQTAREAANYGLTIPNCNTTQLRTANWSYNKPNGTSYPFRALDFDGYYADPPLAPVYCTWPDDDIVVNIINSNSVTTVPFFVYQKSGQLADRKPSPTAGIDMTTSGAANRTSAQKNAICDLEDLTVQGAGQFYPDPTTGDGGLTNPYLGLAIYDGTSFKKFASCRDKLIRSQSQTRLEMFQLYSQDYISGLMGSFTAVACIRHGSSSNYQYIPLPGGNGFKNTFNLTIGGAEKYTFWQRGLSKTSTIPQNPAETITMTSANFQNNIYVIVRVQNLSGIEHYSDPNNAANWYLYIWLSGSVRTQASETPQTIGRMVRAGIYNAGSFSIAAGGTIDLIFNIPRIWNVDPDVQPSQIDAGEVTLTTMHEGAGLKFVVGGASGGTDDFTAGSMQPLLTVKYGTI